MITPSLIQTKRNVNYLTIFSSVFTNEDCSFIPTFQCSTNITPLTDIEITPLHVFNKLVHLDPTKATVWKGGQFCRSRKMLSNCPFI